jgi:DNA-binding NtrC family response regulator
MLVEYFIDRFAGQAGKKIKCIDKKALESIQAYSWPGNIRELQNVIERSVVLTETEIFSVDESWLSHTSSSFQAAKTTLSKRPALQEKPIIEAALSETKGRVSGPKGAAARLGIPSTTLESKIKSLKINKHQFKVS